MYETPPLVETYSLAVPGTIVPPPVIDVRTTNEFVVVGSTAVGRPLGYENEMKIGGWLMNTSMPPQRPTTRSSQPSPLMSTVATSNSESWLAAGSSSPCSSRSSVPTTPVLR